MSSPNSTEKLWATPVSCKSKSEKSSLEARFTSKPCATANPSTRWGLGLEDLTPDVRQQLQAGEDVQGAVIQQVTPGSPADNAGLRQGEVITEVNRKPEHSFADLRKALSTLHNN